MEISEYAFSDDMIIMWQTQKEFLKIKLKYLKTM